GLGHSDRGLEDSGRNLDLSARGLGASDHGLKGSDRGLDDPDRGRDDSDGGLQGSDRGLEDADRSLDLSARGLEGSDGGLGDSEPDRQEPARFHRAWMLRERHRDALHYDRPRGQSIGAAARWHASNHEMNNEA